MTPKQSETNRFIAERVHRVPPSGLHKFFGIAASIPNVISLGVGEPDFPTPPPIAKAAYEAVCSKPIGYTANSGLMELREAIAEHLTDLYHVNYDPNSEILVTVGVSEGFKCVFQALCDPGDEIIVPSPCFVAYEPEIIFADGVPVPVICDASNNFEPRAADIRAAVTEKTKAIFLGFPNNPTGAVLTRENAIEIVRIAEEFDLLIISDEIYDRLNYGGEHLCVPSLPGARERTILMGGFSKDYAMTGWRIGYICADRPLLDAFSKIHQYAVMSAPTISQFAALAALRLGEPYVLDMKAEYDRRRKLLVSGLNQIGLDCFEPRGAFYAFPSIRKTGMTSDDFSEQLLTKEEVAVISGTSFGVGGTGHVRIAYCKSYEQIEIALERIERFVRSL